MTTAYASASDCKTWLKISDSNSDALLTSLTDVVSRWLDGRCGRRFYLDTGVSARTYAPGSWGTLDVDDFATTTGLIVKSDLDADGAFETTWNAADVEAWPYNAPSASPEAKPYTRLLAVKNQAFPVIGYGFARRNLVEVTAKWGWPAVPSPVTQACIIQVGRMFSRRNSVDGIVGETSTGFAVRVPPPDRDVMNLIQPYIIGGVGVGIA